MIFCKYLSYLVPIKQALLSLRLDDNLWIVQHYSFNKYFNGNVKKRTEMNDKHTLQ